MNASEVHLFDWIKENAAIIGSFLLVLWGMAVFWYRTVINKFYPKEVVEDRIDTKLGKCKIAVDADTDKILQELKEIKEEQKHQDDRRREDAIANSTEHSQIQRDITALVKDK